MDYARKCIAIAIQLDQWNPAPDSYKVLGLKYYHVAQYDSALLYYDKALEAAERMRDFPKRYTEEDIDYTLSAIYGNIGNVS
jgi:tetratricopeptide (TPR) repeat protein